ncbi:alpha-mannosidase I MNS4 isoform X2 [Beta vulgaris subsp. vulgaris]|uniref:alpha-mannosidase I MNS4 isoform X2 n=1 Tax=Beta vulgaris subsp. vulgaris TaxID=3555 RepID=UPI002036A9A8|nr:alpha-mannosidase I MNS4 isoform X2 [Beta vulgaris subsp. vulgaris]
MRGSVTWFRRFLWILVLVGGVLIGSSVAESVTPDEARRLRDEVEEMFFHAFNGYMEHAFPRDELKPLSCDGEDTLGGYALTLVDSLDTLALLGDKERFASSVEWIGKNLRFDINKTVSVFETTIRVLGGLLSAHLIASDYATGMRVPSYDNQLLHLAEDLGYRLLPAFDTPTGIPFGSVNLLDGVDENESKITSTAGGGTLTLEFGILSRLTNNPVFQQVTKNAVHGLWACRSKLNLVGAHINVFTGEWTQKDAGIGTSIDSFYEYLLKAFLLFGDEEYLFMFQEAYGAAMHYLFNDPWYVEVNMDSAAIVWPLFNSLQAFWPGLQLEMLILRFAHMLPSIVSGKDMDSLLKASTWLLLVCRYLDVGRDIVSSLQYGARCPCGYCHITDVEDHKQEDHMESFFLSETVKYLWLLFDLAVGPDNLVESGPYEYIFSTEGHLLPATPQISLVREHCSYLGAYCTSHNSSLRQEPRSPEIYRKSEEANGSGFQRGWGPSALLSGLPDRKVSSGSASVKGTCPGLSHGQKIGVSYFKPQKTQEVVSVNRREASLKSKVVVIASDTSSTDMVNDGTPKESSKNERGNQSPEQ